MAMCMCQSPNRARNTKFYFGDPWPRDLSWREAGYCGGNTRSLHVSISHPQQLLVPTDCSEILNPFPAFPVLPDRCSPTPVRNSLRSKTRHCSPPSQGGAGAGPLHWPVFHLFVKRSLSFGHCFLLHWEGSCRPQEPCRDLLSGCLHIWCTLWTWCLSYLWSFAFCPLSHTQSSPGLSHTNLSI